MTVNERIRQDEERAKRSDLIKTWAKEFTNLKKLPEMAK
jgi:serine/threonine-protein kinase RIO1